MSPVPYTLAHVDTDRHKAFPLLRRVALRPAPVLAVTNVVRAVHSKGAVLVCEQPYFPRVLLTGDWS